MSRPAPLPLRAASLAAVLALVLGATPLASSGAPGARPRAAARTRPTTQAPAPAPAPDPRADDLCNLVASLRALEEGKGPVDLDRLAQGIAQVWGQSVAWAADRWRARPDLSAQALAALVERSLNRGVDRDDAWRIGAQALDLSPTVRVLYVEVRHAGTFVILDRPRPGEVRLAWQLLDWAQDHFEKRDELGHWALRVERSYSSGPLHGILRPLPPDAQGHPRFLMQASQWANGALVTGQLGFWTWDGLRARPDLLRWFWQTDDLWKVSFQGPRIRVATKPFLKRLYTCNACADPQAEWTLEVTPTGVKDLGVRFLMPELVLADDLLDRVARRVDASDLASPEAVKALEAVIPPPRSTPRSKPDPDPRTPAKAAAPPTHPEGKATGKEEEEDDPFPLGMLEEVHRSRKGGRTLLTLTCDSGRLDLVVAQREGRAFVAHAIWRPGED